MLFRDRLTTTLQAVALDARAQVVFDRETVGAYRLVGYANRAIPDQQFSDDEVKAGAIGAGHAVTALYALELRGGARPDDHLATVRLRWTDPERMRPEETSREVRGGDLARSFGEADPHFRLDAIVAATAELLHRDESTARLDLRDVADIAEREARGLPPTDEAHAFLELLDQLARLDR